MARRLLKAGPITLVLMVAVFFLAVGLFIVTESASAAVDGLSCTVESGDLVCYSTFVDAPVGTTRWRASFWTTSPEWDDSGACLELPLDVASMTLPALPDYGTDYGGYIEFFDDTACDGASFLDSAEWQGVSEFNPPATEVVLAGTDAERLELLTRGVWFVGGLVLAHMLAPMLTNAFRFWRE